MQFVAVLALLSCVAARAATGPTDPYAAMCFGYLSTAYVFSSACKTNATCLCNVTDFVETSVGCVRGVLAYGDQGNNATQTNVSLTAISKFCKSVKLTQLEKYYSNATSMPAYSGNSTGHKIGTWPVTKAFEPSSHDIEYAYKGYYSGGYITPSSHRYGAALLGYWGGILLLHALFNIWKQFLPRSYQKLHNTKCGRFCRKYLTIPRSSAYLPSNLHALEIFGFVVLSMVFSFAGFPFTRNNYIYGFRQSSAYGNFCGVRTGFLALYVLPLMILFAGRNNILQSVSGLSQDLYITLHRWMGRVEVLLVFIHAIAYTIARLNAGNYTASWLRAYWKWGVVSLAFGCLIVVQAARVLRQRWYETFLVVHIISAVFFIVGGYYHLYKMNAILPLNFFYATIAVWGFDRVVRFARLGFSNFGQRATIRSDSNMLIITAPVPKWWKLYKRPGLYTFIHFLHPHIFFQSHPFTMALNTTSPNELKLVCRVKDGVTKIINDLVLANEDGVLSSPICLDGPYGHSVDFQQFDELLFIAGGVGVTAPFSYIQHLLLSDVKRDQRIRLLWAVRDVSAESWYEPELEFLRSYANVQVELFTGGETEKLKVLDVPEEVSNAIKNSKGSLSILCCGPDTMAVATRNSVAANLNETENYVEYFEESFSW